MPKAVAFRFPDELVNRCKTAAAQQGKSFTAWVRECMEFRLGAPSIADMPMNPLQPTSDVPRDTFNPVLPPGPPKPTMDECAHPWRDKHNVCRVCGHRR